MSKGRFIVFISCVALITLYLGGRLYDLQINKGAYYEALVQGQSESLQEIEGHRGRVFFNNQETLVTNKKQYIIYFWPQNLKEEEVKNWSELSSILNEEITTNDKEILKRVVSKEDFSYLKNLDSEHIRFEERLVRYYPHKQLASHVIGFVGGNQKGQYGLEQKYQAILQGESGFKNISRNPYQYVAEPGKYELPERGNDLYLTIDYNIQFKARQLLKEAYENLHFDRAQIGVINPQNGQIIAMASYPGYNPNQYQKSPLASFKNPFIQELYEPGSVLKPLTMAAAIEEEKVSPETTYEDTGLVELGGKPIRNYRERVWGEQTMTNVLEKSINTGAVFAQQKIGGSLFLDYLKNFGLMKKTGVDLAGEVASNNSLLQRGYKRDLAAASFGQGINITPLQLMTAFSALANDGQLMRPYVVKKIVDSKGEVEETQPQVIQQVISPSTASQITLMLKSVVDNGYGKPAAVPGLSVCGKTGTAQISYIGKEGYSEKTTQSFIGFGPALDPQFTILVKLDNPESINSSQSAAPIFSKLAQYIAQQYQITP